jgi:plasmid stability protein
MVQIIVRNIEDSAKSRLRCRAARHGRSMQEELREILYNAVREEETSTGGLGTAISSRFHKVGLETDILESRGHKIRLASFGRRK